MHTHLHVGEFGMVYKGIYKRSADSKGMDVAIKTIKTNQATDDFMKEMKVMSKLIHPNIVRLHGLVNRQGKCSILSDLDIPYNCYNLINIWHGYRGSLDGSGVLSRGQS